MNRNALEKNNRQPESKDWWLAALLFLAVLAVFQGALRNGFLNFDDDIYVTSNVHVNTGFSWENVAWAFTTFHAGNWHPLTWISHLLDCQFFGLAPWGHHLTSVLFHAVNTALLFIVLKRMTGTTWRSVTCALLFGLHPLRVESVAWIAERKDVLSTLFWMFTVLAYSAFTKSDSTKRRIAFYVSSILFFALGLMSKSMLVTVPFLLILLDYWPLKRFSLPWPKLLIEKLPFLALSIASSCVTFVAERNGGAVRTLASISFSSRLANSLVSYCQYVGKLFWPVNLAMYYPYAHRSSTAVGAAGLFFLCVSVLCVFLRRKYPYLLVGWLWFLGTLIPTIGLVQVSSQALADRYTYIPSVGIFIAVVWTAYDLTNGWAFQTLALGGTWSLVCVCCAVLTYEQIGYWSDSERLYRHTLAVTKDNAVIHFNLGNAIGKDPHRMDEAVAEYNEALRLEPDLVGAHNNLGNLLAKMGRSDEALAHYRAAVQFYPDFGPAHANLGTSLMEKGDLHGAIFQFEQALRIDPEIVEAHANLGTALLKLNDIPGAVSEYQQALRLSPNQPEIQKDLTIALNARSNASSNSVGEVTTGATPSKLAREYYDHATALVNIPGRLPEAIEDYQEALRIDPNFANAHVNLGSAYASLGRSYDAIREYEAALRISSNLAETHYNLGTTLLNMGRVYEAVDEFAAAIKIRPNFAEAHNNLGIALANLPGRSQEAISEFQEALRLNPNLESARQRLQEMGVSP